MKFIYFDASALAKRYSPEPGAKQVDGIFALIPKRRMTCAGINVGEVVSILVRKHEERYFIITAFPIRKIRKGGTLVWLKI